MRFRIIIAAVAAGLTGSAYLVSATAPPKKKTIPPKTAAATAPKKSKKAPAARPAVHKVAGKTPVKTATRSAHATHPGQKAPARPAPARWHPSQSAPSPDRYKEIQEALAKKGYLHGEASGVWNQDSADALRRFQQDQNLQASGKLDSLSIIALGLGPKY